jgi:tRNA(Arg) A34 adenosine deaminase TadA
MHPGPNLNTILDTGRRSFGCRRSSCWMRLCPPRKSRRSRSQPNQRDTQCKLSLFCILPPIFRSYLSQATLHAEFDALSHILPKSSSEDRPPVNLSDYTLYVSVEPCLMCASALRQVRWRFSVSKAEPMSLKHTRTERLESVGSSTDAPTIASEAVEEFKTSIPSKWQKRAMRLRERCELTEHRLHSERLLYSPPYPAFGGYRREEAIILLRRFYLSENPTGLAPFSFLSHLYTLCLLV